MLSSFVSSVNGKWEVKEVPTPQASTNQVLIKIHASVYVTQMCILLKVS
jgi:NADPH:quinone reductase-like Zn-dependent oxidoreductase